MTQIIKTFVDCVNKNTPEYKELVRVFGEKTAAHLVRLNNMDTPDVTKAEAILSDRRNRSYENLSDYLKNSDIVDPVGIRMRLSSFMKPYEGANYVVKTRKSGNSQGSYTFDSKLYNSNIDALKKISDELEKGGIHDFIKLYPMSSMIGTRVVFNQNEIDRLNSERSVKFDAAVEAAKPKQGELFKLTKVSETSDEAQERYNKNKEKWLFTPEFDEQVQNNISNTLYGQTAIDISDLVLAGRTVKILYKDRNGVPGQLKVKDVYIDTLKELNTKEALSLQQEDLKRRLTILLEQDVWDKFQQSVIDKLLTFGYKFTPETGELTGKLAGLSEDEFIDMEAAAATEEEPSEKTYEESSLEGEGTKPGKGESLSDLASIMLNLKQTMSSHQRVWLSSVFADQASFIPVDKYKGKDVAMTNTFVDLDTLLRDVSSATVGKGTDPAVVVAALRAASTQFPNQRYLERVANMVEQGVRDGTAVANEFITKFNQAFTKILMVTTESQARKVLLGEDVIYEEDVEGKPVVDFYNKVIDVNRNDVPKNITEYWFNNFVRFYSKEVDDSSEIDQHAFAKINTAYNLFKTNSSTYFTKDGVLVSPEFRDAAIEELRSLFHLIGVDNINDAILEELFTSPLPKQRITIKGKGTTNAFNTKTGILGTIFVPNLTNEAMANPEAAFGSSGMLYLAKKMAKYTESFLSRSTNNAKGNTITAYGLMDPFTSEFYALKNNAEALGALRARIANGEELEESSPILDLLTMNFNGKSRLMNALATLEGDELSIFLNRLEYSIFDATKMTIKGSAGKTLEEQNEREFVNTQLMLFTNNLMTTKSTVWSHKMLTTASDKAKMYTIRTPNIPANLDVSGEAVKVTNVDIFYNYFLGEYTTIKGYLDASPEDRAIIDANTTTEPKIFYSFGQFNIKSSILWEIGDDGNYKLKELTPEIELFVKEGIQEMLEQDIAQYRKDLEKFGLIKNGRLITGFNPGYFKSLDNPVTHKKEMDDALADIETVRKGEGTAEYKKEAEAMLMSTYRGHRFLSDEKVTKYLIGDFAVNMYSHNIEMDMMFLGDPRNDLKNSKMKLSWEQFNKMNDLVAIKQYLSSIYENRAKRMAGFQGSGTSGPEMFPSVNAVYLRDPVVPSKILSELKKLPINTEGYGKILNQDGQMRHTAEKDLADKREVGKLSRQQYEDFLDKLERQAQDIERTGVVQDENLFTEEEDLYAQAEKPVVCANIPDLRLKIMRTVYIKPSSKALYPQYTQGTEEDKIRQFLYKWNKSGKRRIDILPVVEATKLGARYVLEGVFNPDGSINAEALDALEEHHIDEIPRKHFRIQLEVPYSTDHVTVRVSTQQVKNIFNGILDDMFDTSGINFGDGEMSGKELKDLHNDLYKATFQIEFSSFLRRTGAKYNPTLREYEYRSLGKLQKILRDHAIQNGAELNDLDGLELTDDSEEFRIPLAFAGDPKTYEKLLISRIKDVILQRIHGRSFIVSTEQGFRPTKKDKVKVLSGQEAKDWLNYNTTNVVWVEGAKGAPGYDPAIGLLPQREDPDNPELTLPSQIAITWNFQDENGKVIDMNQFITKKGDHKFLDVSKMDRELLDMIGIRIPNQGPPSMSDMQIVAFIPNIMADLAITSQDLVTQMGWDFDIDKLYSYLFNYFYGYEDDIRDQDADTNREIRATFLALKVVPRTKELKDKYKFVQDIEERQKNKFNIQESEDLSGYLTNSINTRTAEFNKKYDLDVTPDDVKEFLESLTEEDLYAIHTATYSSKAKTEKTKTGDIKVVEKTTLSDLYKDENDLESAKALKNHLSAYNAMFNQALSADLVKANAYSVLIAKSEGLEATIKKLIETKHELRGHKKLLKIHTNWDNIQNNNVKQLHNGMQEIYHAILSHKKVWLKMLAGINEGDLKRLSDESKALNPESDTKLPAMASGRYKLKDWFSNRASKLGVGIFSVNNSFMTLIEGKKLFLSKINPDPAERATKRLVPNPFTIIDSDGTEHEYSDLAMGDGFNALVSIYQSAALDDAKLKILSALNENKYTMGITALIAGLANDEIKDPKTGKPLLNEEFITAFLGQPVIFELLRMLSTGNDSLEPSYVKSWKQDIYDKLTREYLLKLQALAEPGKEDDVYLAHTGFNLKDLQASRYHKGEVEEKGTIDDNADGFTLLKYLNTQLDVLDKFKSLDADTDLIRRVQSLVNTDSKGPASTIQEALYKQDSFKRLLDQPPSNVGNIQNLFFEDGEKTLTHAFTVMGIDAPISLFRGTEETGPILPYSSVKYQSFLREFELIRNAAGRQTFFSAKYADKAWTSFLSYLWSDPRLRIAESDVATDRFFLVYDTSYNMSLASEIELFKNSFLFINNPILKPLFNSLQIKQDKTNPKIKFVEFRGSVGLSVTRREITNALFFLERINYPLFERLLIYTFLIPQANSPTSLRKYVPNILVDAIMGEKLRLINRSLNNTAEDINISISPLLPPVRPVHQMALQHNPNLAQNFDPTEVVWSTDKNMFSITMSENPGLYMDYKVKVGDSSEDIRVPSQYLSFFDPRERGWKLFRLVKFDSAFNGESEFARISLLGAYNLSEYDASKTDSEPQDSILPKNNVTFKYVPVDAYDIVDKNLPTSMADMLGTSGAAYGADAHWDIQGRPFGVPFKHFRADKWEPKTIRESMSKEALEVWREHSLQVLTPEEMDEAYTALEELQGKTIERNWKNDLAARNFFQIKKASALYAVAYLATPVMVGGGTRHAVRFAMKMGKPVFVWDVRTEKWYKWNGNKFVETDTPYLTKNFAAVGTRDLDSYKIPIFDEDGNITEWSDNSDKFVGKEKKAKALQAMKEVFERTQRIINKEELTETEKSQLKVDVPTVATMIYHSVKAANVGHLNAAYGYDADKSGKENALAILNTISKKSKNDSYRILADIYLQVAAKHGTLDNVSIILGSTNQYDSGIVTLDVDGASELFRDAFQYNFLHEINHHFIFEKLSDGSPVSKVLARNLDAMVAELEKPENLAIALEVLKAGINSSTADGAQLKEWFKTATPGKLLEKLAKLRAEKGVHADESTALFSNRVERSILNPLISKFEFATSLLNDEGTQEWANKVKFEGETQNVFERFFTALKDMFNSFLRSLGIKISGKEDTVLKQGIRTITQILSKDRSGKKATLEDLQPDKAIYIEQNGFDAVKTGKKPLRWMPKDAKFRDDVKSETMIGAIIDGDRTSTSVLKARRQSIELSVGGVDVNGKPKGNPYLWVKDDNGLDKRQILIKINTIHQENNLERGLTAQQWSLAQGWDKSHLDAKPDILGPRYFEVDFEYVNPDNLPGGAEGDSEQPKSEIKVPTKVVTGIEINSYQKGLGNDLTNVHYATNGKSAFDIVPSDKTLKLTPAAKDKWGESVEAWYKSNNAKTKGIPEGVEGDAYDMTLMRGLITDKLNQYPNLVSAITENGGIQFLDKSTHTMGSGRWSSRNSKNMFMTALKQAYINANKPNLNREYTPKTISALKSNEIFVFGSNTGSSKGGPPTHGKGAALDAKKLFGAIQGQSEGLQGQSYAIVTKKHWDVTKSSTLPEIQKGIDKFIEYARANPDKKFLVPNIGSVDAGHTIAEIKGLFKDANTRLGIPDNVILSREYEVRDDNPVTPPKKGGQLDMFAKLVGFEDLGTDWDFEGDEVPEDDDTTLPAQFAVVKSMYERLNDRLSYLYNNKEGIKKAHTMTLQEQETALDTIDKRIRATKLNRDTVAHKFKIETFETIARKDIAYLSVAARRQDLSASELLEILQIMETYSTLYTDIKNSFQDTINQSLLQALENAKNDVVKFKTDVLERNEEALSVLYKDATGRDITPDQLFRESTSSGGFRSAMLTIAESHNKQTAIAGRLLSDANLTADMAVIEGVDKDIKQGLIGKWYKLGFDPASIQTSHSLKDRNSGITNYYNNFKTRYNQKAYDTIMGAIWAATGKGVGLWRNRQLKSVEFIVDPRFFAFEDYNMEMGLTGDKAITQEMSDTYMGSFKDFMMSEYAEELEKSPEAAGWITKRMHSIYDKSWDAYRKYAEERDEVFKAIDEDFEDHPLVAAAKKSDWLAYHSPMHIMNEKYALSPTATFHDFALPPHRGNVPTLSTSDPDTGKPDFVPWNMVNPETGKTIRVRTGRSALRSHPRNLYADGTKTGLIDEEYTKWEMEDHAKNSEIQDRNKEKALLGETDFEEEVPTQLGFLNFVLALQKKYVKFFPDYLKDGYKWYHKLDIGKPLEESLQDVSLFYKYKILLWDKAARMMAQPYKENTQHRIDLITKQTKKAIDPKVLGGLSNQGLGDFKTDDLENYLTTLIKAGVEFSVKTDLEKYIKLMQYAWENGDITEAPPELDGPAKNRGKSFTPGEDKEAFTWAINRSVYGEDMDRFLFNSVKSAKFKEGKIPIDTLHSSRTKMFGVFNADYKLTPDQKKKKDRLIEQRKELKETISGLTDKESKRKRELEDKLKTLEDSIANINRVSTPVNKFSMFEDYIRLSLMGWSTQGRIMDTFSTTIVNSVLEAQDGRLSNYRSVMAAFAEIIPIIGLPYAAKLGVTYSVVNLVGGLGLTAIGASGAGRHLITDIIAPFSTSTGLVAGGLAYGGHILTNKILRSRAHKEFHLLITKFGATDRFESFTEEQKSQILRGLWEELGPMSLVQLGETFNKGHSVLTSLNHTKVKCPDGKSRSLRGAYKLNAEGTALEWNTEVYGSEAEAGYEMTGKNKEGMLEARRRIETLVKRLNGDYSRILPKLVQKSKDIKNMMIFLRGYLSQALIQLYGGEWTDYQSMMDFQGQFGGPFKVAGAKYKKAKEAEGNKFKAFWDAEVPHHYQAANQQLILLMLMIGGALAASSIISTFHKDLEDAGQFDVETTLTSLNLINRFYQDRTQTFSPQTFQQRSMNGISAQVAFGFRAEKVVEALWKALSDRKHDFWTADRMTPEEMIAAHIAIPNEKITTINEIPYWDKKFEEIGTKNKDIYLDLAGENSRYAHVALRDRPSRTGFALERLFPGFAGYRSQQNLKRNLNLDKH